MSDTSVRCADPGEAADLAAFLGRLLHYDKAAAVRLQAAAGALAVFGRPPSFEVLAIRTVRLAPQPTARTFDVTVSAGDLLETVDEATARFAVPAPVTGPPWAGLLPPRGGWHREPVALLPQAVRGAVAQAVAEFRTRMERLAPAGRTRAELDRIGREVWSRTVGDTSLPVRAAHAAQALGFLRPPAPPQTRAQAPDATSPRLPHDADDPDAAHSLALFSSGAWLRLRTPYGSVAVRRGGLGMLGISPRS
ncbi:hypothetical protein ACQYWQ_09175 [Streptomyces sp. P6-2-1]|uniref:hypothetical protein n=1 Tax=Streptomyces sp. P6-2-1 TaxID=3422591 RepID=UPI003D3643C1